MVDKYAVIGNPIEHSKSPLIHAAFARQTSQEINYERMLVPLDGFEAKLNELIEQGYKGVNVTVPFKFEALRFVSQHGIVNSLADTARAVNTITFNKEGSVTGDNTDGIGLVNDITHNLKFDISNKKVLLLGSGGAKFTSSKSRGVSIKVRDSGVQIARSIAGPAKNGMIPITYPIIFLAGRSARKK